MAKYLVRVSGTHRELRSLASLPGVYVLQHSVRSQHVQGATQARAGSWMDERAAVDLVVDSDHVHELRDRGFEVELKDDLDERGNRSQALVGKGNRFEQRVRAQSR